MELKNENRKTKTDILEFRNVSFKYPLADEKALDNISFHVRPSEFLLVCGKSGCGKTTLLRHIKKNLIPYGVFNGKVLYNGETVSDLDDRRSTSEIGFVRQNPDNQIVTDQVWHELAFGLESLGIENSVIKRRVAEMASYFDIQTWFRKKVNKLSGGQKQLMNLASVMAMQPELLVLDEPTSQLDPIAASEFLNTVYKINRNLGTTVIISEHRLEEVFTMADRVMVMDGGRIVAFDKPREIGSRMAGNRSSERNPMFYGLPSVMRIFHEAGGVGSSPLTIREGRLWVKEVMKNSGISSACRDGTKIKDSHIVTQNDYAREDFRCESMNLIDKLNKNDSKGNLSQTLSAKNLWFRYDKKSDYILRGMNLNLRQGELFCLLGGNGSGKSTLLKALSGIIKCQRGDIKANGGIAMLPQNPQALFTEITTEEDLLEALYYSHISDEEKVERVESMLNKMEIIHLRKSHPYDLSGGEQQRLALGKVLLLNPDIILLDEPTKGLDPFFRLSLARVLKDLKTEGRTIFMVSHDIEFCAENADICAMLFDGDIISVDNPVKFFSGNNFYTTTANMMVREYFPNAVTWREVVRCIRESI